MRVNMLDICGQTENLMGSVRAGRCACPASPRENKLFPNAPLFKHIYLLNSKKKIISD